MLRNKIFVAAVRVHGVGNTRNYPRKHSRDAGITAVHGRGECLGELPTQISNILGEYAQ